MYKELDKYKVPLDGCDVEILDNRIKASGVDDVIQSQLRFLDCTRTIKGQWGDIRAIQTIDYTYKDELSKLLYVIDNYCEDKVEHYAKLLELHTANIEYEKQNPPIIYKKKKRNSTSRSSKTTTNPVERKTSKERKAELKIKKLSLLTFKLK